MLMRAAHDVNTFLGWTGVGSCWSVGAEY